LVFQFLAVQLTTAQVGVGDKSSAEIANSFFQNEDPLSMQLKFSTKDIKKKTNDSTYITSILLIQNKEPSWDSLKIKLRARGKDRRQNCYFAPLKLKLKKKATKGTMFEGTTKLKLVLPCLLQKDKNDLVLKEYMAYKLYEIISPYHFRTRLANIEFVEERRSRIKKYNLKAILIEDIDKVAQRHNGRAMPRNVHPLHQDDLTSLQNSFFQYLIGNTDFSTRGRHNQKLLYTDNKYVSIPYDFDMSGLVNAPYAGISGMENMKVSITAVTQRVYKGYKRDYDILQKVRVQYITSKDGIFAVMDSLKQYFQNPMLFLEAKDFVDDFYEIMESDKKFEKFIVNRARTK
jgi:hypothetical protein